MQVFTASSTWLSYALAQIIDITEAGHANKAHNIIVWWNERKLIKIKYRTTGIIITLTIDTLIAVLSFIQFNRPYLYIVIPKNSNANGDVRPPKLSIVKYITDGSLNCVKVRKTPIINAIIQGFFRNCDFISAFFPMKAG